MTKKKKDGSTLPNYRKVNVDCCYNCDHFSYYWLGWGFCNAGAFGCQRVGELGVCDWFRQR